MDQPKKTRMRYNPVRRWTKAEENALVKFLLANRDFERPTAQSYYRQFLEEAGMRVEWKLLRAKVRNMRTRYAKAKEWHDSTSVLSMDEEILKANLLKMFAYYYQFEVLFGGESMAATEFAEESLCTVSNDSCGSVQIKTELTTSPMHSLLVDSAEQTQAKITYSADRTEQIQHKVTYSADRAEQIQHKVNYSCTAAAAIREIYSELQNLQREKMEQDIKMREREMNIREREVALREREIELKAKELEVKERLTLREREVRVKERELSLREREIEFKAKELELKEKLVLKFDGK
ncbi:uncharacterized protein [Eurosta solidaginis]|uniref:uncharacterized protein n=1 Tax=Eurosta solidaginis TaxID=178769 RepID=UPI00353081FB